MREKFTQVVGWGEKTATKEVRKEQQGKEIKRRQEGEKEAGIKTVSERPGFIALNVKWRFAETTDTQKKKMIKTDYVTH